MEVHFYSAVFLMKFLLFPRSFAAFVLSALVASATAHADLYSSGVNLGAAGRTKQWAIFSLGGGVTDSDALSGNVDITGDIGVAGSGNLTLSGNVLVNGNIYYHTGGTLKLSGNATITGNSYQNASSDSMLDQAVIDAKNASNAAFALPASAGYPTTINTNKSLTLSGSGTVVLKLTDFVMSGNSTLTLQGTAATTFIINVSNTFSLSSAKVVLSGGLLAANVLYNVRGNGSDISMSSNSELSGTILATNRNASLSGQSSVIGSIIANKVTMSGGSTVKLPPTVSH